jgi:hypothetical protein
MPLEAFAQTVITLAPEAVGGLTYVLATSGPLTPSTFLQLNPFLLWLVLRDRSKDLPDIITLY